MSHVTYGVQGRRCRGILDLPDFLDHQNDSGEKVMKHLKAKWLRFWQTTNPRNPEREFGGITAETAERVVRDKIKNSVDITGMRTNR